MSAAHKGKTNDLPLTTVIIIVVVPIVGVVLSRHHAWKTNCQRQQPGFDTD